MEFRLTYAGQLLAHRDSKRLSKRSSHVHAIRKVFHKQLMELWRAHPVLNKRPEFTKTHFEVEGFTFLPIATNANGLICKLDLLMLRGGDPGKALSDIDNRLKTLFDALKMPKGAQELGEGTSDGKQVPDATEKPFYVLLEDDSLITHVAVISDGLLESVPDIPPDEAVRLILDVTIRPYGVTMDSLDFV
jgi:hypothetical protein